MMKRKASGYKPLLFTTTIRNPERFKEFLFILSIYKGKILTNELAIKISAEIVRNGVYKPTKISEEIKEKFSLGIKLSNSEVEQILEENPQDHKEAGFDKGWPSRFDTWFKLAKEMGLVFYKVGEKIQFSELGSKLIDPRHPEYENPVFLNIFAKYQRNNPFRRVLNENVPLLLLLNVIKKLNEDPEFNDSGITRQELLLVIYWKDNDHNLLYERIKKLRKDYGYNPSIETILDICKNEIMEGEDIKRSINSIMKDYTDEFIRKMRLTGVVSIRGGGRFLDVNKNEISKVNYILQEYSEYEKFETEEEYFEYCSAIDENLFSDTTLPLSQRQKQEYLMKWTEYFNWDIIKSELLNLSKGGVTEDDTLRYLSHPIRLEFLTALAIKSRYPSIEVVPNYPVDDEGIPTSTAGGAGNKGDIECYENSKGVLVEVTMSQGRSQTVMEIWPIARHLEEFQLKYPESICYFVAPSIYTDSIKQIDYVKNTDDITIVPKSIQGFVEHIEHSTSFSC